MKSAIYLFIIIVIILLLYYSNILVTEQQAVNFHESKMSLRELNGLALRAQCRADLKVEKMIKNSVMLPNCEHKRQKEYRFINIPHALRRSSHEIICRKKS